MAGDGPGLSVRRPGPGDLPLPLAARELFDDEVRPDRAQRLLAHPDHHLFAAIAGGDLFGLVSAVTCLHPDKPLECWLNELGVREDWQRRGVGRNLMNAARVHARAAGCHSARVLTNSRNRAASGRNVWLCPHFTMGARCRKREAYDVLQRYPPQFPRSFRQCRSPAGAVGAACAAE